MSVAVFIRGRGEEEGEGSAAHQARTEWHAAGNAHRVKAGEGSMQRARSSKSHSHEPTGGSVGRRKKAQSQQSSEDEEDGDEGSAPRKRSRSHDDLAEGGWAGAGHARGVGAGETSGHTLPKPVRLSSEPPRKRGRSGMVWM